MVSAFDATSDMSDKFIGTRPVAPQHAFDLARLSAWMAAQVHGFAGPATVLQFKGASTTACA